MLQDVRVRPQGWVEPGWVGAAEAEQWEQAQAARWADPHEQPQVSGPSWPSRMRPDRSLACDDAVCTLHCSASAAEDSVSVTLSTLSPLGDVLSCGRRHRGGRSRSPSRSRRRIRTSSSSRSASRPDATGAARRRRQLQLRRRRVGTARAAGGLGRKKPRACILLSSSRFDAVCVSMFV